MECVTTHLPNELDLEMDGAQEEGEGEEDGEEGDNINRNFLKHSSSFDNQFFIPNPKYYPRTYLLTSLQHFF
jgi:hypothetical protein